MLKDTILKPVYATGEDEPIEFFVEGLMNSISLDFGLGYFSSSAISTLSIGFAYFLKRGGKVRILINDSLSREDKEAVIEGKNNSLISIEEKIITDIIQLKNTLSKRDHHFFKCLSWLIANKKLEIKATIPKKSKVGIVHQKFGMFTDLAEDKVIFTGSANFSATALLHNVEDIWCDFSWNENAFTRTRIKHFENIFYRAWNGISDIVEIIPIEKVNTAIRKMFPVSDLEELIDDEFFLIEEEIQKNDLNNPAIKKLQQLSERIRPVTLSENNEKHPELRPYQLEAISNWKNNNYMGILEMATGTGKTITALTAIKELYHENGRLVVIISCPFIHLAEQWQEEAMKFGIDSLLIGESKELWEDKAVRQAQLFKRSKQSIVVFITTNVSFKSESFQKIIALNIKSTLLVIDEVHYAGALSIRKVLPSECKYRLGLSATPERHGDDEGTQILFDYFNKVVFSFPIEKAIGKYLTNYYYYPVSVELTESEFEEYRSLTMQIVRLANKQDDVSKDRLQKLAIKRARVQNNSINKLEWISDNIHNIPLDYSLFYAGDQIFSQVKQLLGKKLKVSLHEFTSRQNRNVRKQLLKDFSQQKIQSLIAMKCLDEGVDIPPTRVAFFLASSSNPREFIQRRGRVLRLSPGKDHAIIYDLISIPPKRFIDQGRQGKDYLAVKSAFAKEYRRVQEFASMALNQFDSLNKLFLMANQLDLLDITND
jgi:superfamily II DNA or RNA helicase